MFNWKKKGLIWQPDLKNSWMQEYGQNPNAVVLEDRIRIYFSSRKKDERVGGYISYIFFIDVDKDNPSKIININEKPLLNSNGLGEKGAFDEFGTMPGSIISRPEENEMWLYYVGWSRPESRPYQWGNSIAVSKDNGATFEKPYKEPVLSKDYNYPYLHACPRVYQLDKNQWVMWYAGGMEWYDYEGRMNPIYVIKMGTSTDGINWELSEEPALPLVGEKECQSSANLFEFGDRYHMFFSYRDLVATNEEKKQYRIGYASSDDMINWKRDDSKAGIDVSSSGWDSEAVCYPHIVNVGDKIYMFYSGNQYGRSGFGYAELEL